MTKSKFNNIAIAILMFLIIIAFALTGITSFTNNSNSVAMVDDKAVTPTEYNNAYNRMINYWTQINQGKSLSQKQIRERGIQQSVLEQLITQKLSLVFAENLKFNAGKQAIKKTLTSQYQAFQSNGRFDITKYKTLLRNNGILVSEFEQQMIEQVKVNKLTELFGAMQFSKGYAKDYSDLKAKTAKVTAITFQKEKMIENLKITKSEIKEFMATDKSKAVLDTLYKVYVQQNPIKKGEKQKTLKQVQNKLATNHLQKTKREELKIFNQKLEADLKAAFDTNKWKTVESLAKKYNLTILKDREIQALNTSLPGVTLKAQELAKAFSNKNTTDTLLNNNPLSINLVKITKFQTNEVKQDEIDKFVETSKNSAARRLSFQAVNFQRDKSKITRTLRLN